jgi:SNF2 family DNA or RNA helicase
VASSPPPPKKKKLRKLRFIFTIPAHNVRNTSGKRFKSVQRIKRDLTWCVTGTELQNRVDDVAAYVMMLGVPAVPDLPSFMDLVLDGQKICFPELAKLYGSLAIRRVKEDPKVGLLELLPPLELTTCEYELTPTEMATYQSILEPTLKLVPLGANEMSAKAKRSLFAEITRLRQVCCNSMLAFEPKECTKRPVHSTKTRAIVRRFNRIAGSSD